MLQFEGIVIGIVWICGIILPIFTAATEDTHFDATADTNFDATGCVCELL